MKKILGIHASTTTDVNEWIAISEKYNFTPTVQVFNFGPKSIKPTHWVDKPPTINYYVHASYLTQPFSSSKGVAKWMLKREQQQTNNLIVHYGPNIYPTDNIIEYNAKKNNEINVSIHRRWCIDTAHAYVSGVELTTEKQAKAFFSAVNGLELIHLNDNLTAFNSGRDIHAPITTGNIWKDDDSGLKYIFSLNVPLIFEHVPDMGVIQKYL